MVLRSRRYVQSRQVVDHSRPYSVEDALNALKSMPLAHFDETVECHVQLSIDPRHSDQQVRGSIALPHGTGKTRRVAVFADGSRAEAARQAGADIVGSDDLIAKVEGGFVDFDVALATPDMMGRIGRLGRHLGPRGLMPSPKSGTVREDIGPAVTEFKGGRIEFRNDAGGNIHVAVGKLSFPTEALAANVRALIDQLVRIKPPAAKGKYLMKVCLAATMSPAVPVTLE